VKRNKFRFSAQHDTVDCGPACLKMLSSFYGKEYTLDYLREICYVNREGVSLLVLEDAAKTLNFDTLKLKLTVNSLKDEVVLPCILFWKSDHFIVLKKIQFDFLSKKLSFFIADPALGSFKIDQSTFYKNWYYDEFKGIALVLEPSSKFILAPKQALHKSSGLAFLRPYLISYKAQFFHVVVGMLIASVISLIFPILTQKLIDEGVQKRSISVIQLILFSQLFLLLGQTIISLLRNFFLIHINSRVSISIISEFLKKVMTLPIRFFDSKSTGDFMQRINDHERIEIFLTRTILTIVFSLINIVIFSIVLLYYSINIFIVFAVGSCMSVVWIWFFQKKRLIIDYKKFQHLKESQNSVFELISGMQEIKINNCEKYMRAKWEHIQSKLFGIQLQGLIVNQFQEIGSHTLTIFKNIIMSYIVARLVLNGSMTLGALLSISYIVGELNLPLENILQFFRSFQEATLSINRLSEIHNREDEGKNSYLSVENTYRNNQTGIVLKDLVFQYEGPRSPKILNNINFTIPFGAVTAIVGASGSGKTTLLKLLLKFYEPTQGSITIGDRDLVDIQPEAWRNKCGSVMQDGFIFSESIDRNIALNDKEVDYEKLGYSAKMANIDDFIESLPLKYKTKIGNTGSGLSAGQKQRILIARAIYKNPDFLFLDEATSALDSNNEKIIVNNLNNFFVNKTVIIIAHRLSTVINADKIMVLKNNEIVQEGTHKSLVNSKGYYYDLIRNQLDLG